MATRAGPITCGALSAGCARGKERRLALELFPEIELVSTLDVLAAGAAALGWDDEQLSRAATDLRWRGNFAPPRKDPRAEWYLALLDRDRRGTP